MNESRKKIFLVEDDEALRESLKILLEESGFEVHSVADGKTALKFLQQNRYDGIILDDNLPFIQGSDLLGLIRIQSPDVKIIIMSGLFNTEGIRKIKEQGADFVIEKPFDVGVIIDFLNKKPS